MHDSDGGDVEFTSVLTKSITEETEPKRFGKVDTDPRAQNEGSGTGSPEGDCIAVDIVFKSNPPSEAYTNSSVNEEDFDPEPFGSKGFGVASIDIDGITR